MVESIGVTWAKVSSGRKVAFEMAPEKAFGCLNTCHHPVRFRFLTIINLSRQGVACSIFNSFDRILVCIFLMSYMALLDLLGAEIC